MKKHNRIFLKYINSAKSKTFDSVLMGQLNNPKMAIN